MGRRPGRRLERKSGKWRLERKSDEQLMERSQRSLDPLQTAPETPSERQFL